MTTPQYDEFSLFHQNAEEFGIELSGPPTVVRVHVDVGGGGQISALRWGVSDPELVLLHGGAQNADTWDTVALALARPLVALDLPGHGHSSHRDDHVYWPADNAVAIETAVRALAPDAKVVVGMSLGGLTALALTDRAPDVVRSLVLVDVTPGVNREKSSAIAQFIDGPEYFESFDEILERTVVFNPTRTESSLRRGILHNAIQAPDGRWRWRYDLPRRGTGEGEGGGIMPGLDALWDAAARVQVPFTLVRGSLSPVVDDEDVVELRRRNPNVVVEVVEDAGHSVQGDKPIELARAFSPIGSDVLPELPASFGVTRGALHALAEQVIAGAYYGATTHIGLRANARGFGTPVFGDRERIRVDGNALVHERAGENRRHQLTTLRAAAAFVGVPLGAPPIYAAATTLGPDAPLLIDRDAALVLADWYALAGALLQDLRAAHPETSSSDAQLWPEHFDLGCELGDESAGTRANYGASPGDDAIPEPYLYVGPWDATRRTGAFAVCPFGAALTYSDLRRSSPAGSAGRQFYESAFAQLAG